MGMKKAKGAKPGPETRDRIRRMLVAVTPGERAEIERRAVLAGMSLSAYLRTAGLNHPIRSMLDYQAALELAKVSGDLGRLGGLLKQWLAEPRSVVLDADLKQALRETRALQDRIGEAMGRVVMPRRRR